MNPPHLLDVEVGFYRRANGKRPWRREPLRVILEMIRAGDLWRAGDALLAGLTVEAVVRATALEAAWAADVAPSEDGDRGNPAHATFYERKAVYSQLEGGHRTGDPQRDHVQRDLPGVQGLRDGMPLGDHRLRPGPPQPPG